MSLNIRSKHLNVKLLVEHYNSNNIDETTYSSNPDNRTSIKGYSKNQMLKQEYNNLKKLFQTQEARLKENQKQNIYLRTVNDEYKIKLMNSKCKEKDELENLLNYIKQQMKEKGITNDTLEKLKQQHSVIKDEVNKIEHIKKTLETITDK